MYLYTYTSRNEYSPFQWDGMASNQLKIKPERIKHEEQKREMGWKCNLSKLQYNDAQKNDEQQQHQW